METLPELPKIRKHKEADITPAVMLWFKTHWPRSYAVEVKIAGGKIKKHQPVALKQVDDGIFDHKLKDNGSRNPFDFFGLKDADAFIVYCNKRKCTAYNHAMKKQFTFTV